MKCNQMIFNFVVIRDMSIMTSHSIKAYVYIICYMLSIKRDSRIIKRLLYLHRKAGSKIILLTPNPKHIKPFTSYQIYLLIVFLSHVIFTLTSRVLYLDKTFPVIFKRLGKKQWHWCQVSPYPKQIEFANVRIT